MKRDPRDTVVDIKKGEVKRVNFVYEDGRVVKCNTKDDKVRQMFGGVAQCIATSPDQSEIQGIIIAVVRDGTTAVAAVGPRGTLLQGYDSIHECIHKDFKGDEDPIHPSAEGFLDFIKNLTDILEKGKAEASIPKKLLN